MRYIDHIGKIILDKAQVNTLIYKNPIVLFLINDRAIEGEKASTNKNHQFIYLLEPSPNFKLQSPLLLGMYNGVFGSMSSSMEFEDFVPEPILESPLSNQLALYLVQELMLSAEGNQSHLENMIVTMGDYLLKRYHMQETLNCKLRMGLSPFQVNKVQHYVRAHIDRPVSTLELAKVVDLSMHHFIRVFKKTTGETPHQFVTRIKLEEAKKMLIATDESVIQVGLGIGCENASHFSQLFKSNFGIPPLKFRKAFQDCMQVA